MKISVIIPIYNVKKYIRECIDSVLSQTFTDYEIILVNDGSTDESVDICAEYCKNYPDKCKLLNKENGGASSARNYGLKYAKGEYIYFLDSDDYILPETFEKLIASADESNSDLVFFEAKSFDDETGKVTEKGYSYKTQYETMTGKSAMRKMIENDEMHFSTPLLFLRNNFLLNSDISCREGIIYEDMIYVYKVFSLASKVSHIHEKLYMRRFHKNSVMTSKKSDKNFKSALTVYYELYNFMREKCDLAEEISVKYISRWAMNTLNDYRKLSCKEKRKNREDFIQYKSHVKDNKYFNNIDLKWLSKGYYFWILNKTIRKICG